MNKADYQDTLKQFFSDKSKSKNIKKKWNKFNGPLSGLRGFLIIESPLKALLFHVESSFCSWDFYFFALTFRLCRKKAEQEV